MCTGKFPAGGFHRPGLPAAPMSSLGQFRRGTDRKGLPRDILTSGSTLVQACSAGFRSALSAMTFGLFALSSFVISSGLCLGRSALRGSR